MSVRSFRGDEARLRDNKPIRLSRRLLVGIGELDRLAGREAGEPSDDGQSAGVLLDQAHEFLGVLGLSMALPGA